MLDRDTLEEAANAYFAQLVGEILPPELPDAGFDEALDYQIELTEGELGKCHARMVSSQFTDGDRKAARAMLKPMGVDFDDLGPDGQVAALCHVVRAKRQQMRYLLHSLQTPQRATPFR